MYLITPVKAKADHSWFAAWQRDIMDYPTHLSVLRTPLLIYRHQRRMTELCINLPTGIYLSASFSSFQACILAQGIVPTAGCCVGVGSRHVGTVLFCSFLVLSYLHYNNDRERPISVLMCDAAAGFSITYLMRALHRISTGTRHIPVYLHKRSPFYGCNRDVAQVWVAARRPLGYGSTAFSSIP